MRCTCDHSVRTALRAAAERVRGMRCAVYRDADIEAIARVVMDGDPATRPVDGGKAAPAPFAVTNDVRALERALAEKTALIAQLTDKVRSQTILLDERMGTPCEQVAHESELADLTRLLADEREAHALTRDAHDRLARCRTAAPQPIETAPVNDKRGYIALMLDEEGVEGVEWLIGSPHIDRESGKPVRLCGNSGNYNRFPATHWIPLPDTAADVQREREATSRQAVADIAEDGLEAHPSWPLGAREFG